ncbi:unnamed protein product [Brassica oleracea var. botrytis]
MHPIDDGGEQVLFLSTKVFREPQVFPNPSFFFYAQLKFNSVSCFRRSFSRERDRRLLGIYLLAIC